MNPYTIISVMLGMNRFHQKDTEHPFNMSALDGYVTMWLPQIQEIEKTNSTLFYETLMGVENARKASKKTKDDYVFIFGRGTIGPASEDILFETMQQTMGYYGQDVNHIIIAKSFGVADTLTALKKFKIYHKKPKIKIMVLIDGYLPPSKKRIIAKKLGDERYFVIPKYVDRCIDVYQRVKGTEGRLAISANYSSVNNFEITQNYVDIHAKYYYHYSDGYSRKLDVCHFNMEEIVSIVPCLSDFIGNKLTLSQMISKISQRE